MGKLIEEINQIDKMIVDFDAGKLNAEDYMIKLAGYSQTERRHRDLIAIWALCLKSGIPFDPDIAKQLTGAGKFKVPKRLYDRTKDRGK